MAGLLIFLACLYVFIFALVCESLYVNSYVKRHKFDIVESNNLMNEATSLRNYFSSRDELISHLRKVARYECFLYKRNKFNEKPSVLLRKVQENEQISTHAALERTFNSYKELTRESGLSYSNIFWNDVTSYLCRLDAKNRIAANQFRTALAEYEGLVGKIEETVGMDGHDFEQWCANLLRKNGFTDVAVTPGSGDQGVDVVAVKDGVHYAIQCKCYASPLGNTPVQEVFAGKEMYGCQVGVVMTNNYFTQGAKALAEKTRVLLWDRDTLASML